MSWSSYVSEAANQTWNGLTYSYDATVSGLNHVIKNEVVQSKARELQEVLKKEQVQSVARTTGAAVGGVGGFYLFGPEAAVAGGIAGAAAVDGAISYITGDPVGYVEIGRDFINGMDTWQNLGKLGQQVVFDGTVGYAVPYVGSKVLAFATGGSSIQASLSDPMGMGALSKAALDNRANQLNPNHLASGPGRSAGYHGLGTPADLNNHANNMNPDNWRYYASRGMGFGGSR